jgi:hypothetical protein
MQPQREAVVLLFLVAFRSDPTLPEATMSRPKSITGATLDRERTLLKQPAPMQITFRFLGNVPNFETTEDGIVRSLCVFGRYPCMSIWSNRIYRACLPKTCCRRLGQVLALFPYLRAGPN